MAVLLALTRVEPLAPEGNTGRHLLAAIQSVSPSFTAGDYWRGFQREALGLAVSSLHSRRMLRASWRARARSFAEGTVVVAIGSQLRSAVSPQLRLSHPCELAEVNRLRVAWLPLPSARNRWWSIESNRLGAGLFLLSLLVAPSSAE